MNPFIAAEIASLFTPDELATPIIVNGDTINAIVSEQSPEYGIDDKQREYTARRIQVVFPVNGKTYRAGATVDYIGERFIAETAYVNECTVTITARKVTFRKDTATERAIK